MIIFALPMEKYIVSARKYRPATFGEVVGQASVSTTLKNSILNGHLGHAYLFSGPRGVGKTTCARIFARTINCAALTEAGEACNQCESCRSFNENRSYNIHELDAASNNSVEDIRTLTEQVRIPPQIGSYSVYIIDEVHMLSQSAFNAFLKTLEEPPSHAVFILATTEKHKIIPTILSRCQIFDFNRIRVEDAVEYLKQIAGKESLDFEEEALHMIALKADGAMRDALSIFDQVVSFSGGRITYQDVIRNLNILDVEYYFRVTDQALEGDVPSMLLLLNEVLEKGFDARNFINGYAAHLRNLMVCRDPATVQLLEVGAGIRERYLSQSGRVGVSFLYEGLEICNQADIEFRASRNQRLTVELALLKLGRLAGVEKKKQIAETRAEESPGKSEPLPAEKKEEDTSSDVRKHPGGVSGGNGSGMVEEAEPETALSGREKKQNEDGASRVVRKPSISIRGSMKKESPPEEVMRVRDRPAGEEAEPEEAVPLDLQLLLKAWDDYASSVRNSRPRVYSTLQSNRPELDPGGKIRIALNTEVQRENFVKNIRPALVRYIQEVTGIGDLEIRAELQELEQNGKKIYTDQDKLEYLMKKNPELGHLKSRFNLDFDQ